MERSLNEGQQCFFFLWFVCPALCRMRGVVGCNVSYKQEWIGLSGTYYTMQYGHLQKAGRPANGSIVNAGDIVGIQGLSGNLYNAVKVDKTTDPHVHIVAKKRNGNGWDLDNDYTIMDPEELLTTKFDAGGKTKYGITKRTWDAHAQSVLGIDPRTFPVENITEAQATKIYKQVYWGWSKAEDISRMDGDLATVYFNFFANTPRGAVQSMQRALNSAGHSVSVDGGMGPQTLDAIENAIQGGKLGHLHNEFKDEMQNHYNERTKEDPENSTFSNGWTNRINRFSDKSAAQTRNVHCKN